jgi:2-methylcitrate dehydratase PrpD
MSETRALSAFATNLDYDDIPQEVIDHAKRMILDVVGVSLAATDANAVAIAEETLEGSVGDSMVGGGHATTHQIVGRGRTADGFRAAMVNGILGHMLDFDDAHLVMRGHPTAPVWPAVLAVSEELGVSGTAFLRAFVAGVETELVLGEILNPGHYEVGWHPTAVFGHLGAATGAGSLLGLDTEEMRNALGIATSQTGGVKANFGTMTKPYHVGRAARAGIEAARLAENGFTGNPTILEEDFGGYFAIYEGDPSAAIDDHLTSLGDVWRTIEPPVHFKAHPCCGGTHEPIEAALALRAEHDIDPETIESVSVHRHPRRIPHIDRPNPASGLEGKFSVQYAVTLALRKGDLWLDDFTDSAVRDPANQRLLERVTAREDSDLSEIETVVRVRTDGGDVYEGGLEQRSATSDEQLEAKFRRCAAARLDDEQIDDLYEAITSLETLDDVNVLSKSLTPETAR